MVAAAALAVAAAAGVAPAEEAVPPEPCGKLLVEATTRFPRNGEGTFVKLPSGELAYYYGAWPSTSDAARQTCIARIVSRQGGRTWSSPEIVLREEGQDLYHPGAVRAADGTLGLAYTRRRSGTRQAEKVFRYSSDDGRSWSDEVAVSDGQWKYYTTGAHDRLVRLESGRLITPVFYAQLNSPERVGGKPVAAAMVFSSDDHGRTWNRGTPEPLYIRDGKRDPHCEEPCIVEVEPDELLMVFRTLRGFLYESRSEDGGRTWTGPCRSPLANPRAPARLEKIPGRDAILVVHNPDTARDGWHRGARLRLVVRTSRDGGRTWSDARELEHSRRDHWYDYPSVLWDGDVLHLAYRSVPRGSKGWKRVDVLYQRVTRELVLP